MTQSHLHKLAAPFALRLQKRFRLFPQGLCLITGAPRSGTSALCDWLGIHSAVSSFPESRILVSVHTFLEEALRFKNLQVKSDEIMNLARNLVLDYHSNARVLMGKNLIVDKEPLEPIAFPSKEYGQFIANFMRIFPNAKVLFAIRDPIATVWSMSQRAWGESLTVPDSRRFRLEEYIENWCACAELISTHADAKNVYVVQFGRLVRDADNESKRILDFLGLPIESPFQPRRTHEIGFSKEDRKKIQKAAAPYLENLRQRGITDL